MSEVKEASFKENKQVKPNQKENDFSKSIFVPVNNFLLRTYLEAGLSIYLKQGDNDFVAYLEADAARENMDKFFASLIQKIDNQEISLKLFIKNEERVPKIDKIQEAFKKEIKTVLGKEEPDSEDYQEAVKLLSFWTRDLFSVLAETKELNLMSNVSELAQFVVSSFDKKLLDSLLKPMEEGKELDFMTSMHLVSVMLLTINYFKYLENYEDQGKILTEEEQKKRQEFEVAIAKAALLHDIGKLEVSNEIILKSGKLTDEEFAEMKTHPVKGYHLIEKLMLGEELEKFIKIIVLLHHRKKNGVGYPSDQVLKDSEHGINLDDLEYLDGALKIPWVVQVISSIDILEAITANRVYQKDGASFKEALEIMQREDVARGEISKEIWENLVRSLKGDFSENL